MEADTAGVAPMPAETPTPDTPTPDARAPEAPTPDAPTPDAPNARDVAQVAAALARYGAWWADRVPGQVTGLDAVTAETIRFIDPFNDLHGRAAVIRLLAHLDDSVAAPRFQVLATSVDLTAAGTVVVSDTAAGGAGALLWRFTGQPRRGGAALDFMGMSRIALAADGRVLLHHDHFDPSGPLYRRIPLLAPLVRLVQGRLRVA